MQLVIPSRQPMYIVNNVNQVNIFRIMNNSNDKGNDSNNINNSNSNNSNTILLLIIIINDYPHVFLKAYYNIIALISLTAFMHKNI